MIFAFAIRVLLLAAFACSWKFVLIACPCSLASSVFAIAVTLIVKSVGGCLSNPCQSSFQRCIKCVMSLFCICSCYDVWWNNTIESGRWSRFGNLMTPIFHCAVDWYGSRAYAKGPYHVVDQGIFRLSFESFAVPDCGHGLDGCDSRVNDPFSPAYFASAWRWLH